MKKHDALAYLENHNFLTELRELMLARRITTDELVKFREQALSGDADGAVKGLANLLASREAW